MHMCVCYFCGMNPSMTPCARMTITKERYREDCMALLRPWLKQLRKGFCVLCLGVKLGFGCRISEVSISAWLFRGPRDAGPTSRLP